MVFFDSFSCSHTQLERFSETRWWAPFIESWCGAGFHVELFGERFFGKIAVFAAEKHTPKFAKQSVKKFDAPGVVRRCRLLFALPLPPSLSREFCPQNPKSCAESVLRDLSPNKMFQKHVQKIIEAILALIFVLWENFTSSIPWNALCNKYACSLIVEAANLFGNFPIFGGPRIFG